MIGDDVKAESILIPMVMAWGAQTMCHAVSCLYPFGVDSSKRDVMIQRAMNEMNQIAERLIGNRSDLAEATIGDVRLFVEAVITRAWEIIQEPQHEEG